MTPKLLVPFFAIAAGGATVLAQAPADKPLTESQLLHQLESFTPGKPGHSSSPKIAKGVAAPADSLFGGSASDPADKTPAESTSAVTEKKAKGPTEITALRATFDQRKNVAVFVGSVVVKDPEFNVTCDKLTAYLKHENKAAPASAPPAPAPAVVANEQKKKGGGLESALAESTTEKRVVITQDKIDPDGSVTHGIGIADQAHYDAVTGDIVLTGSPDVTSGDNRCVATDPHTVITLNRDGHMRAVGPHKTILTDTGDSGRSAK